MENIIIVEENKKYCFSNIEEVVRKYLGDDYYNLSDDEKYKRIRIKTVMNSCFRKIPIKDLKKHEKIEDISKEQYIIYDEETFLLSLAKNNDIVIYEKENSNLFAKDIDKKSLERVAKEYIRINDCANELLENKLKLYKSRNY